MDIDVTKLSTQSKFKIDRLFVTVYLSSELQKSLFKGFAKSVSSADHKGPFDILPTHENFVTQVSKNLEIVPEEGEKVVYKDSKGVLEVANNIVRVFLDSADFSVKI